MRKLVIALIALGFWGFSAVCAKPLEDTLHIAPQKVMLTQGQARLTLLRSLVVPGWGEHSLGYHKRGLVFNTAEILGWVTFYAFQSSGLAQKKDMRAFAVLHAGINPQGKDAYYYTDIGNYDNIYEYNDQKLRNRQVDYLYPVTPDFFWAWDSAANRQHFDKLRIRSATQLQYATFMLGGLVLNRIVSMLDIVILTRNLVEKPAVELESSFFPARDGATFSLSINF